MSLFLNNKKKDVVGVKKSALEALIGDFLKLWIEANHLRVSPLGPSHTRAADIDQTLWKKENQTRYILMDKSDFPNVTLLLQTSGDLFPAQSKISLPVSDADQFVSTTF